MIGGWAAAAALYPLPLARAISQKIGATTNAERVRSDGEADRLEYVHAMANTQGNIPTEGSYDFPGSISHEPMEVK